MLFNRKSESSGELAPEPSRTPEPARPPTKPATEGRASEIKPQSFIDASLTIMGDVHSHGDVHLDGRICGNVRCAQLIVNRDAAITGAVTVEEAIVRGAITGTIRAPVVILQDTARVDSEITYTLLAIDDGATFEGMARHSASPLEEPDRPAAQDAASPLAELQQMVRASAVNGTGGSVPNGHAAGAVGPPNGSGGHTDGGPSKSHS